MLASFSCSKFDVTSLFVQNWQEDIDAVAADADFREFPRTPILSRESENVTHITRGRVHAGRVQKRLPWLYRLYKNEILELASQSWPEPIKSASDDRYGIVLNVQRGNSMRFECHIDSNPVTGLLFFTEHDWGGGELVIGHDPAAIGVETVERDCSVIEPRTGLLVFFDGKTYPHYARALVSESDVRVVAVMNFYTESCPESTRPRELNRHLFGAE